MVCKRISKHTPMTREKPCVLLSVSLPLLLSESPSDCRSIGPIHLYLQSSSINLSVHRPLRPSVRSICTSIRPFHLYLHSSSINLLVRTPVPASVLSICTSTHHSSICRFIRPSDCRSIRPIHLYLHRSSINSSVHTSVPPSVLFICTSTHHPSISRFICPSLHQPYPSVPTLIIHQFVGS